MFRIIFLLTLTLISLGAFAQKLTLMTELDKTYIEAAGGYLQSQNAQGIKVANAMAGLNSGETTLEEVQDALKDARSLTNIAFQGDYLKLGKLVIPAAFTNIDQKIRHSHDLRDAAYAEYLAHWKDANTIHIRSSSATFQHSEKIAQEATRELTTQMKTFNN